MRFSWRKLSQIARFCLAKRCHTPNFAEKTFTYSHKTAKFVEVFSLKSFLLYGVLSGRVSAIQGLPKYWSEWKDSLDFRIVHYIVYRGCPFSWVPLYGLQICLWGDSGRADHEATGAEAAASTECSVRVSHDLYQHTVHLAPQVSILNSHIVGQ